MTVEWLIVGGGIHGTYVARELRDAGVPEDELVIIERTGELLGGFRRQARACGMETLRSNYVQHVGPDPFGLEAFAESQGRECELVPTNGSQPRPTLDLFLDHAEYVVDRFALDELTRAETVTGIDRSSHSVSVQTDDGTVTAKHVVLAIGPGSQYKTPDWYREMPQIEHVWDRVTRPRERVESDDTVLVVGGGMTAGQFATAVAGHCTKVTLLSRDPIQEARIEADPQWLNWNYIVRHLHSLPSGSQARYDRVRAARNDTTMAPYLRREVAGTSSISRQQGEIAVVFEDGQQVRTMGAPFNEIVVDKIILATGFEPVTQHTLVSTVANSLELDRGFTGVPVLDDDTLAWRRQDGTPSNLFVTGKLGECTIGPFAGNIAGARRAAERLVAVEKRRRPKQTA